MTVLRSFLLYLHILSVILSIGPFFVLIPMLGKLRAAAQDELRIYLGAFRFAVRLSKHAGHVLVGSGVLLAWIAGYRWDTSWIVMTVLILTGSLFFMARAFSPHLRSLEAAERGEREPFIRKLRQAVWTYLALLHIMLWFMVAKPNLW